MDYAAELQGILENSLTPRNIEHYADEALQSVAVWLGKATVAHAEQAEDVPAGHGEAEDAALTYFELPPVNGLLDHLSSKVAEIKALDAVIDQAGSSARVIIPPGLSRPAERTTGESTYTPPEVVPRLKTTLFTLSNEFGIDVHKPGEIVLEPGGVKSDMRRRHGYYFLRVPSLERTILVCDEMQNVTYVFDDNERESVELTDALLKDLAKTELNGFIETYPNLGVRIVYSDDYVDNLSSAIRDIAAYDETQTTRAGNYLVPPAPEGYMSTAALADCLALGDERVNEIIDSIRPQLGVVERHRYGSRSVDSWSPGQQGLVMEEASRLGLLANRPSEEYPQVTKSEIAHVFKVSEERIEEAIEALGENLGPVYKYLYGSQRRPGYDPWQQKTIYDWLVEHNHLFRPAPETYLSVRGITQMFGFRCNSGGPVQRTVEELGDKLGPTETLRFASRRATGYDHWQQNMIYDVMRERGDLAPKAPDDVWSRSRMHEEWGISHKALRRAIGQAGEALGTVDRWNFSGNIAPGYGTAQRAIVRQNLQANGLLKEAA